jgi:hypothetical protein
MFDTKYSLQCVEGKINYMLTHSVYAKGCVFEIWVCNKKNFHNVCTHCTTMFYCNNAWRYNNVPSICGEVLKQHVGLLPEPPCPALVINSNWSYVWLSAHCLSRTGPQQLGIQGTWRLHMLRSGSITTYTVWLQPYCNWEDTSKCIQVIHTFHKRKIISNVNIF